MKTAILYIAKHLGLFHLARWLLRDRLLILCYHGFSLRDEEAFRPALFMRPETFRRRMDKIAEGGFTVLPLEDALTRLKKGNLPRDALVITLDDGFYSVKQVAQPILSARGFPSTLYATTNRIALGTPVFRLTIQYMFWKTREDALRLEAGSWGQAGRYDLADPEVRSKICWQLIETGERSGDESIRESICRELADKLRVDYDDIVASGMFTHVSPGELKDLDRNGMDVQLHTHTHKLTHGGQPMVHQEISRNADLLQSWLTKRCAHFCYPNGDWQSSYLDQIANMGVESATTCDLGWNRATTHQLALHRFLDGENVSDLQFEAEIYGFTELLRTLTGRRQENRLEGVGEPGVPPGSGTVARE